MRKIIAEYLEEYGEWFHNQERWEADRKAMCEVIADWESEHGPLTAEDEAETHAILGL